MAIHAGGKVRWNLRDAIAVEMQDIEAFEEKGIAERLNQIQKVARYTIQPIQSELPGGIVGHLEENNRQHVA